VEQIVAIALQVPLEIHVGNYLRAALFTLGSFFSPPPSLSLSLLSPLLSISKPLPPPRLPFLLPSSARYLGAKLGGDKALIIDLQVRSRYWLFDTEAVYGAPSTCMLYGARLVV
jgi:hypothetical protein